VADLLMHVPRTYIDRSTSVRIADAPIGEEITLIVKVNSVSVRRPRRNLAIIEAVVSDETGRMKVVWFNQTFRPDSFRPTPKWHSRGRSRSSRGGDR
jgi:ATP-dependent DNA helicase RecG